MAFLHEKSGNKPTESNIRAQEDTLDIVIMESVSNRCDDIPNANDNAPKAPQAKRKKKHDVAEKTLSKSLADCDEMLMKAMADERDEDALYCRSHINIRRELPKRRKRLAKIELVDCFLALSMKRSKSYICLHN